MTKWYCLTDLGELWLVGLFESFDEAETAAEQQGHNVIWLLDEKTASQWRNTLSE